MKDIQNHWAQACIESLVEQGLIAGYPDGTFRPEQRVTRAEFATLLIKAFPRAASRPAIQFIDVSASHWATAAIRTAYETGWLSGYPGKRFRPNQAIPRVQAVIALAAGLEKSPGQPANQTSPEAILSQTLADAATIPSYARAKVAAAIEQQLVVNYPDVRRFRPNQSATRAEIAALLCQAQAQTAGAASPVPTQLIATPPNTEIRGVWLTNIDSQVLFSRAALTTALDRLSEHQFNTVYPTVWNWGYTLYPSAVTTRVFGAKQGLYPDTENQGRNEAAEAAQANRDMLLETIELAQARNLSVIPWFEFGLMAPADSPLAQRHPDWLTQRRDGTTIDYQDNGKYARVWLNPCHPEVQQFLVDLVDELSANYAIDGFQLDDHFGLPVAFGYDETTKALYQQATGNPPPADAQDPTWMRWRADQITHLMKRLFTTLKARRPQAVFSVSPSPAGFAYNRYLQDWPAWERSGYIEELLVQIYRRDLPSFIHELEKPALLTARGHIPTAVGILTGLRQDPLDSVLIENKVQATRQRGYAGVAFFFYDSIWQVAAGEPIDSRSVMVRSLFDTPKSRPGLLVEPAAEKSVASPLLSTQ
ncbi:MAG: family 10 glycosylhydrolase [Cyanobacteria bacterium P01_A01_bin.114]